MVPPRPQRTSLAWGAVVVTRLVTVELVWEEERRGDLGGEEFMVMMSVLSGVIVVGDAWD